jgi:GAF domain-containing protein
METFGRNIKYLGFPARISAFRDVSAIKSYGSLMQMKEDGEDLLLSITSMFVANDDLDKMVSRALQEFGTFSGACRVHLFEIQGDKSLLDNTSEWCAPGYPKIMEGFCSVDFEDFSKELERVRQVADEKSLLSFNPNLSPEEKEAMEFIRQRGYAFLDLPLYTSSGLVGMLSLEYPEDSGPPLKEQTMLRQIFSSMLEVILDRKRPGDNSEVCL